jgi:hypothetical protein
MANAGVEYMVKQVRILARPELLGERPRQRGPSLTDLVAMV